MLNLGLLIIGQGDSYQLGIVTLIPPVVAILLAIATRRVIVPLASGVIIGAFLVGFGFSYQAAPNPSSPDSSSPDSSSPGSSSPGSSSPDPSPLDPSPLGPSPLSETLEPSIIDSVSDSCRILYSAATSSVLDREHLMVLAFSIFLGALVGLLERGGSMHCLIDWVAQRLKMDDGSMSEQPSKDPSRSLSSSVRRKAQQLIAGSGLMIFFDDYASSLLVGGTMRSTADRFGVSREKLAYLVDSTSAPIAGLSVISTWAAIEMSYMAKGLRSAGYESNSAAFDLFLYSIVYRFYPILAIAMVAAICISGRDFGPMLRSEREAVERLRRRKKTADLPSSAAQPGSPITTKTAGQKRLLMIAAILPLAVCLACVLGVLIWTGSQSTEPIIGDGTLSRFGYLLGNGDPYLSLVVGGVIGLVVAIGFHFLWSDSDLEAIAFYSLAGAWQMLPAMAILWLAWALSDMTDQLHTGDYLAEILRSRLPSFLLPTVVFVTAGLVAFSTGTSFGTMGLLTPISVSLSLELSPTTAPTDAIVLSTCGAVLAGAIFGDHCSPLSDTTLLSSRSSGCDHMAHVRTQLPYAIVVALISILLGTLPSALGYSPWLSLAGGVIVIAAVVGWFGENPDHLQDLPPQDL